MKFARIHNGMVVEFAPAGAKFHKDAGFYPVPDNTEVGATVNSDGSLAAPSQVSLVDRLTRYATALSRHKQRDGVNVKVNGIEVPLRTETLTKLCTYYTYLTINANATVQWKLPNGTFAQLNINQVAAMITAAVSYVAKLDACEARVVGAISTTPPSITQEIEIDAAFAAVNP